MLWPQLELAASRYGDGRSKARAFVDAATADRFPHAACARAFVALRRRDRRAARKVFEAARGYVVTREPRIVDGCAHDEVPS
jgi:hypothetical protein